MKRFLLLALPLALMTACNKPAPAEAAAAPVAAAAPATLDGSLLGANHWLLESATDAAGQRIDALFARADKPVTLDFGKGRLSVSNTCNGMGSGFALEGDALTVSPMMSTMKACPEEAVMALDNATSSRLEGALKVQQLDATTLKVSNAAGDVLSFRGEPTAETRYGGEGETAFLDIDAQTKPCSNGVMQGMQCLQVREVKYDGNGIEQGERGQYSNFFGAIEGYTHEDGIRNVLRVKRYTVKNPPADGSSLAYVLDMVVSSEIAKP